MHSDIFTQLSLVIVAAAVISLIMRLLRQPLIMGYIITGIVVGPSFLNLIHGHDAFETFSEIGIALLLFIIGLELSVAAIKRLGKPVFLTALSLLLTIGTVGYLVGVAMGFTVTEAVITGLALFFSSTIIIAKVLSDKKELTRLNGQIAIGVILLDDIIATFALLYVTAQSGDPLGPVEVGLLTLKGVAVIAVLTFLGMKVLPRAAKYVAKSQELLFICALGWGFGVASLVNMIGFSVEIGALFAGVTLAHLPYVHQIGAKLKPLRDFFIIIFFITLGQSLLLADLEAAIVPALLLSVITILLKPLAVMTSLGLLGYTKRTSFKTAVNLSQISEFSIILVVLAASTGVVGGQLGAIITLVAIITITLSTYLMKYDDWIYRKFEHRLHFFERSNTRESEHRAKTYPLVLFGYLNGGAQFVKTFRHMNEDFVVVDYDPEVIEELDRKHIHFLYGDATDHELLADINMDKIKLVVNTIADHDVNKTIVRYIRHRNKTAVIVCYSNTHHEASELYRYGATYVVLPSYLGSEQLSSSLKRHGLDKEFFYQHRKTHLDQIDKILSSR